MGVNVDSPGLLIYKFRLEMALYFKLKHFNGIVQIKISLGYVIFAVLW